MNLKNVWEAWKRIVRLSRKPDSDEYKLSIKISLLAFFLVGGIAYIIRLISYLLQPAG